MKSAREDAAARVAAVRTLAERRLSPEEFEAYVNAPLSNDERAAQDELVAWFLRRYPTPADRLRYARAAHRRWRAAMPDADVPKSAR